MTDLSKNELPLIMTWQNYCEEYQTDTLYFVNDDQSQLVMVAEGSGDNLDREDEAEGYVDYFYIECYGPGPRDGGMLMRTTLISEDNPTIEEIVNECNEFEENLIPIKSGEFHIINPETGSDLENSFIRKEMMKWK